MSLQDRLDAFKADFEGRKAPPGVVQVAQRATAALVASGQAGRALHVGARAPEFALPDPTGQLSLRSPLSPPLAVAKPYAICT